MKVPILDVFLSTALGVATCEGIGVATRLLPYSVLRNRVTDVLSLPGGWMASWFYPEGVHTGNGAPAFLILCLLGNYLFYAACWFLLLRAVRRWRRSRRSPATD